MDDTRVWAFEKDLWSGEAETYHDRIADDCQMVVPARPYLLTGSEAVDAMTATPRWSEVAFEGGRISRPQEGVIVIAYTAQARRDGGEPYVAHCTSTYLRRGHEDWVVVQHQQTPPMRAQTAAEAGGPAD